VKVPVYDYSHHYLEGKAAALGGGEHGDGDRVERDVDVRWERRVKVVFSGWGPASSVEEKNQRQEGEEFEHEEAEAKGEGVEVEIWKGGVRSLRSKRQEKKKMEADASRDAGLVV
jgi:hypothetical protein